MRKLFLAAVAALAVMAGNAVAAGDFTIGPGGSFVSDTSTPNNPPNIAGFAGTFIVGDGGSVIENAIDDAKILRVASVAPDQDLLVVGPVTADMVVMVSRNLMLKYLTNLVMEGRLDAADVSSAGERIVSVSPRALERLVGVDKIDRAEPDPDREMSAKSTYRVDMNGTRSRVTSVAPDQDLLVVGPVTAETAVMANRFLMSKYLSNLVQEGRLDAADVMPAWERFIDDNRWMVDLSDFKRIFGV